MNKKIKDLTLEEMEKICNKHDCWACPLNFKDSYHCVLVYKKSVQEYEKFDKEQEVEIDE